MSRKTLYVDGHSTMLNLVCKLTPLAMVEKMIFPMVCCASLLNSTSNVDFFIMSLSSIPITSKSLLNKMLVELNPSSNTRHSTQLFTINKMTNPSWCSSLRMSSSSKVMDISSNFLSSSDLQDFETLNEEEPSLASRLADEYVTPQTLDPLEITLITSTCVGGHMLVWREGIFFFPKDVFPLLLRRSHRCPLFNMKGTSLLSAM